MAPHIWFWVLMAIYLFVGIYRDYNNAPGIGGHLLHFVILVILGWGTFGSPFGGPPLK